MRAGLGHAVAALRHDAAIHQGRHDLAGHRRARDAEPRDAVEPREPARAQFGEQVDGVGRHADQEAGAGLEQAVEQAGAARQVVDHQLGADRERGDQRAQAEIVAERAQRVDDRARVDLPVAGDRARIGEQRVVAVHHALGLAGGARGEGEIDDAVGIAVAWRGRRRAEQAGERRSSIDWRKSIGVAQMRQVAKRRKDVAAIGIGAVARLGDQRRGAGAREQADDVADRVITVQRRAADIAGARAGEQRDHGLDAAGQPDGDALTRPHAARREIVG